MPDTCPAAACDSQRTGNEVQGSGGESIFPPKHNGQALGILVLVAWGRIERRNYG